LSITSHFHLLSLRMEHHAIDRIVLCLDCNSKFCTFVSVSCKYVVKITQLGALFIGVCGYDECVSMEIEVVFTHVVNV